MNILFVSQKFPYPLNDGGNIRSFHIIQQLAKKHSVSLLSTVASANQAADCGELRRLCSKIQTFPRRADNRLLLADSLLRSLFSRQPYFMHKNFSPELLAGILAEMRCCSYQVVHFNHLDTAQYVNYLPGGLITVLDTHNILSLMIQRFYQQEPNPIKRRYIHSQWQKTLEVEKRLCQRMNLCLVCSESDARELASLAPQARIRVIPNGTEADRPALSPTHDEPSLVFIGAMDYMPNYQGVLCFCEQTLPRIEREIPGIRLYIIGRNPVPSIRQLENRPNIRVLDKVDDIQSRLHPEQILVVPLRIGGGTRLKILEAMSLGLPVVSTSIGAEGLEAVQGKHILIADEPQEMAQAVIRLYNDKALRQELTANARRLIKQKYDWEIIGERLLKAYSGLHTNAGRD
jgi:glycosyltransferase involved in cell wall biosynthesis